MTDHVTPDTLHRGAKYFMDTGRVTSETEAMALLRGYGLSIRVGPEVKHSRDHQIALLTLVNCARRTLLGGIEVLDVPDTPNLTRLVAADSLRRAVVELGGILMGQPHQAWPIAVIGTVNAAQKARPAWQLTWSGWRAGVTPLAMSRRLDERDSCGLAPVLAAATCAAEVFFFHAQDHPMAGHRTSGLSLWRPGTNWLDADATEPIFAYLPSRLWLVGLGNLGQAYLWVLGCLEFARPTELELMLQDFDRIVPSNDSTSLLSSMPIVGQMKTRALAAWVERRGFRALLEERRFGLHTRRAPTEAAVALCGVDNALARRELEQAGFEWIIETGLGAGAESFKNFSLHTFPSSLSAATLWSENRMPCEAALVHANAVGHRPAYAAENHPNLDACGLAQLASRTIGVPFVGLTAATLAIAELLRRLHGGESLEVLSGSVAALEDVECIARRSSVYAFGHNDAINMDAALLKPSRGF